jgi:hypothetical protein
VHYRALIVFTQEIYISVCKFHTICVKITRFSCVGVLFLSKHSMWKKKQKIVVTPLLTLHVSALKFRQCHSNSEFSSNIKEKKFVLVYFYSAHILKKSHSKLNQNVIETLNLFCSSSTISSSTLHFGTTGSESFFFY